MAAPIITTLDEARCDRWLDVPELDRGGLAPGVRLYAVSRGGWFRGRRYTAGEVLVCEDDPGEGDAVVPAVPELG